MEAAQSAPFLAIAAVYARPLYVFQRDGRGSLTAEISDKSPGAWVFSALVRIDDADGGIEKLVRLCRSAAPEDTERIIAKMAFFVGQADPTAASVFAPFGAITVGLLRLALNEAVRNSAPLTAAEMIKLVKRCPYVLFSWVVSFSDKTPEDYAKMCSAPHEANWMHALLADIGRDFPDFNRQTPGSCALALNTEKYLSCFGKADVRLPLSCYATPRCMYTTCYLTESMKNARTHAEGVEFFERSQIPTSLKPHSVFILKNYEAGAFQIAFLSKALKKASGVKDAAYPGLETIEKDLDYSFPVNLTLYYDVVCQYYRKVLFSDKRVTEWVAMSEAIRWQDGGAVATFTRILPMPLVYVDVDPLSAPDQSVPVFLPLTQATDSDGELMRSSTLSELVESHFYVTTVRGTLRL